MLPYVLVMVVLVAVVLWATKTERSGVEWIAKPLAALTFIAAGWASGALESLWGTVLFVGLVLAAIGDVLLIPRDERAFLAGLISFLLGHVAYAIAFGIRGLDLVWTAAAAGILAVVAVPVVRWLWPNVEAGMRVPVMAYVVVITAMVALAAGTLGAVGDPRVLTGAFVFYLSDLCVARDRFVQKGFANRLVGLPLYFGAQLVLASTPGG